LNGEDLAATEKCRLRRCGCISHRKDGLIHVILLREKGAHIRSGHIERAKALLPPEKPYPLDDALAGTIGAN
jgi:hypothetical protein